MNCRDQRQLSSLNGVALKRKVTQIFSDPDHLHNSVFEMLLLRRYIEIPMAKKSMYEKSFISSATALLKSSSRWLVSSNMSAI